MEKNWKTKKLLWKNEEKIEEKYCVKRRNGN